MAAEKFWALPELVENMLLYLPLRDLLLAQNVCKHWKLATDGSIKAQRALFLKPYSSTRVHACAGVKCRNDEHIASRVWNATDNSRVEYSPMLNPFLNRYVSDEGDRISLLHNDFISGVEHPSDEPCELAGSATVALKRPASSLLRMLPMQPSATSFSFPCMEFDGSGCKDCEVSSDTEENMVRVGDLMLSLNIHNAFCPNCPIYPDTINRWRF